MVIQCVSLALCCNIQVIILIPVLQHHCKHPVVRQRVASSQIQHLLDLYPKLHNVEAHYMSHPKNKVLTKDQHLIQYSAVPLQGREAKFLGNLTANGFI